MGFYDYYLLPRIVHFACRQNPAMKQRAKIVPLAAGRVLEIGIGSGLNIPFYDPGRVTHLWGLDPSPEMWSIALRNAEEAHLEAEYLESGAESMPLENDTAGTVVMTYTLCTIPDPRRALDEIRRVLKLERQTALLRTWPCAGQGRRALAKPIEPAVGKTGRRLQPEPAHPRPAGTGRIPVRRPSDDVHPRMETRLFQLLGKH